MKTALLSLTLSLAFLAPLFGQRNIQFREVDFTTSVIELYNFGTTTQNLTGWRFCSHDEDQVRRYSPGAGLEGLSIAAGESLFLHFLNDAPSDDATAINISSIGNANNFASPLDRGPYAIQLYNGQGFSNGNNIIDHLQWSIDGLDNASADDRSDEAESGGVWTDQSLWIATTAESEKLTLTDATGGILHSPANYQTTEPVAFPTTLSLENPSIAANGDVTLHWEDLSEFGTIEYLVEVLSYDATEGFQVTTAIPFTTFTATLTDLNEDSQFFRVTAQLAPQ